LLDLVLLPLLCDVTDTGSTGKLRDDDWCKGEFRKRNFLARDGGLLGGTIEEDLCLCEQLDSTRTADLPYTLVVNDLDDDSEAALVLTLVEEDNTANLYQPPGARCNFGVTHFVDMCCT
jgi:hypothetical protein